MRSGEAFPLVRAHEREREREREREVCRLFNPSGPPTSLTPHSSSAATRVR